MVVVELSFSKTCLSRESLSTICMILYVGCVKPDVLISSGCSAFRRVSQQGVSIHQRRGHEAQRSMQNRLVSQEKP